MASASHHLAVDGLSCSTHSIHLVAHSTLNSHVYRLWTCTLEFCFVLFADFVCYRTHIDLNIIYRVLVANLKVHMARLSPARVLYWFHADLRLHDCPALHAALNPNPDVFKTSTLFTRFSSTLVDIHLGSGTQGRCE